MPRGFADANRPDPSLYSHVEDKLSRSALNRHARQRGQLIRDHIERFGQATRKLKEVEKKLASHKTAAEAQKQQFDQLRKRHEDDNQKHQAKLDERIALYTEMKNRKESILEKKRLHKKVAEGLREEIAALKEKVKTLED
jgi:septal ring factor EnvC (AmiA/AmiB activator)